MLLIDSLYINNSGGKVLLDYLVSELEKKEIKPYYLFDFRCVGDYTNIPKERKIFLRANIENRNRFYKQYSYRFSFVFCFGNIPPSMKLNVPVYTYFHNVSLLKAPSNYGFKEYIFKYIKRQYIKWLSSNTSFFLVQSSFVKKLLCNKLNIPEYRCIILPFFKEIDDKNNSDIKKKQNSFLYVSNGNTHKNHNNLLIAWEKLAINDFYPELHLTITPHFSELIKKINLLNDKGLNIFNHGFVNPIDFYKRSQFVIYPSLTESFGLGLIEGIKFGCDVIASDREYVYNVVKPSKVFDPSSPQSIAQVVECCLTNGIGKTELVVKNQINELIELISNETNNTRP
jgi:hypothetical protein